jgi:hypothetical protein
VLKRNFIKINPRRWFNVLWIIILIVFASGFFIALRSGQIPGRVSSDFLAFYTTAQIAQTKGFSQVYNLQLQSQYQEALHRQINPGLPGTAFVTVPVPYLPFFILLFLPLTAFDYSMAFIIWDLVNLVLLLVYLYIFTRRLGKENGRDLLIPLIVCIPVFSNFFLGQINVLLMIFLAEFLLASLKGNDNKSGLWLSGLLLKPQTLILIIPGLLIQKRYKTLIGFALGSVGILLVSILLVGPQSLAHLCLLLLGYLHGLPSNSPEAMMNWRALGMNLSKVMPDLVAAIIALEGMVLTVIVTLSLWKLPFESTSPKNGLLLLATFAGTLSVTWHAHIFIELILIPLILFLYTRRLLPWKIIFTWTFLPPIYLAIMIFLNPANAYILFGLGYLAVNVILLGWAARSLYK